MNNIVIFAGTTEGRKLSEYLSYQCIKHIVCVATEYGEIVLKQNDMAEIHRARMNQNEIKAFLKCKKIKVVVDATHPYAEEITNNIKEAIKEMNIIYFRLKRQQSVHTEDITYFETNEMCAKALEHTEGNILLTTGSKELHQYCNLKDRLYVRVLPSIESISLCIKQGICGKQIIAMQGPFSMEINEAMIHQYKISYLVTKESGISGGYFEKLQAAKKTDTQIFVIGRPKEEKGYFFDEICSELEKIYHKKFYAKGQLEIILAGIGMGHQNCITKEVQKAIENADILLGAERMLQQYHSKLETHPYYQSEQIIPYLKEIQNLENKKIVILFSGDTGFYSGCQLLYSALQKEINEKRLNAFLHILPGISSVAYLSACIGESYQNAAIYSMHGKEVCNIIQKIKRNQKIFLLTSGVKDINKLGKMLIEYNMTECDIIVGYQLSYEQQQIKKFTPQQCCEIKKEGLYTCFIKNPYAINRKSTHGISDTEFIRGNVPMTKEEVREVSICKLQLHDRAVVYDIGSGTGSIAIEIANLSDTIQVYAIEQKKEAIELIEKNKKKFQLQNITVIEGTAPEVLSDLPIATHAFIGGSNGKLKEILKALQKINKNMRIVTNAVTMETICEINTYPIKKEIVQLQVNKVKELGKYHLLQSDNPIWICTFFENEV